MDAVKITIGSNVYEGIPCGYMDGKFVRSRTGTQIFFRTRFDGLIVLSGDAYDDMLLLLIADNCNDSSFEVTRNGETWDGLFSIADGEFDLSRCTFSFTPRPNDGYDEILQRADEKINVMDMDIARTVQAGGAYPNYTNSRFLMNVVENMVQEIDPSLNLLSTFFTAANNPVTGVVNRFRYLFISQKSDVKRPLAAEPVRFAYMSLNEILEMLRVLFNVYWNINGTDFVLEHYENWISTDIVDIRAERLSLGNGQITFDRNNKWKNDRIQMLEYGTADFTFYAQLRYEGCTKLEDNERVKGVAVTTDLPYFLDADAEIGDEGWVIFACTASSGSGVFAAEGFLTGNIHVNCDLAPANLFHRLHRHNAPAVQAYLFFDLLDMWHVAPDKFQTIPINQSTRLDLYAKYQTLITDVIGVYGNIVEVEENVKSAVGIATIGYSYPEITPDPPTPPVKSVSIFQDDSSPYGFTANFSELSGIALVLNVAWVIRDGGGAPLDTDNEDWNVPDNVWTDSFDPTWGVAVPWDPSYCVDLVITPSDPTWTIILNQPPTLEC